MLQTYVEIFLIGLFGSMHCVGMCGGFVAMYSLRKPAAQPSLLYHLLYNIGRITTYSLLGGVLGSLGSFFVYLGGLRGLPGAVLLFAGTVMVLMGMNIAGAFGRGGWLEDGAITETSMFRSILHRILAVESAWSTFLLGLLLGLLPCGLLYPVLMTAAASGGFGAGVSIMVVFGLGTLPAMLAFGYLITRLRPHFKRILYRVAAVLVILLGIRTFLRGMVFNGWIPPGRFW